MNQKKTIALAQVLQRLVLLRLFMPLVALSLFAIGGAGYFGEKNIETRQRQTAQFLTRIIERYLDQSIRAMDAVALVAEVSTSKNLMTFMKGAWRAYKYFDTFYYVDKSNRIRLLVPFDPHYIGLDMSRQPYLHQIGDMKDIVISHPFISLRTGNPAVYLVKKLSSGGKVIGELSLGSLQDEITRGMGTSGQETIFIMDQTGMLLAHPSFNLVKQQTNQSYLEIFKRALRGNVTQVYNYAGAMVLGSAARVERVGWIVVDQIPLSVLLGPLVGNLGLTLIVALVIWLALTWSLRKQLEQHVAFPLTQLSRWTGALANGDFRQDKILSSIHVTFSELTVLVADFQNMGEKIQLQMKEISDAEKKYHSIFENAMEGIFQSTPQGRYISVNPSFAQIHGFNSPAEFIDHASEIKFEHFVNNEDRKNYHKLIEENGSVEGFIAEKYRKDESKIWVSINARSVYDQDGKLDYYEGSVENVTERKLANEALKESEEKYRQIVNIANEGIWVLGSNMLIVFVNARMSEMLGVTEEEMIGESVTTFMFEEDWTDHQKKMENRRKGISEHYERRYRRKDGQAIWTLASEVPVNDNEHRYKGSMGMFTDITELKHATEALKRSRDHLEELVKERTAQLEVAKEQAESANRAKSTFLANMSHELRTPLNAILGFARLTKEAPDVTSEQRKNLDIITLSGGHLLNLINNVLDISKIESGRMTLDVTPIDLYQLIQEMKSLLFVNAEERGLSFSVEQSPQLPRRIEIDGGKLRQVLINLIGNAIKYTKQGGVVLRAMPVEKGSAEKVWLRFEIEDTGPGISEEERKLIFKPFIQLKKQMTIETGTGLGLAICKQYVDLMGGKIDVISEKGKGSLFFFEITARELPLEESMALPERGRVIGLEKGQPRYRLLIAEDQIENRILLHKVLEPFGFDMREAANGKEAVEIFEQWHPDLIWMDIRMPVMDGLEATHRIRSTDIGAHTKIIAITAQALEDERVKIMQAGCDDFVRKPYRNSEIYDTLTKHLGLQFIYGEKQAAPQKELQTELRPEHLANVPGELIKELHLAVIGLNAEHIQVLTKMIMNYDQAVGAALNKLASRFEYRRLLELLDEYAKNEKGPDKQK